MYIKRTANKTFSEWSFIKNNSFGLTRPIKILKCKNEVNSLFENYRDIYTNEYFIERLTLYNTPSLRRVQTYRRN